VSSCTNFFKYNKSLLIEITNSKVEADSTIDKIKSMRLAALPISSRGKPKVV
jgi:hypothetical protein